MKKYIKANSLNNYLIQNPDGSFKREFLDEHGQTLTLCITNWANGWDWYIKDSNDYLIADSDGLTFDSAQHAFEDFEDWKASNA